jgi:desulfoferrodoxin (superoxide reductase-like protein)
MKRKKQPYTTIQVSKEINKHIREFCKIHGLVASTLTEQHWIRYISSSMSGSISL